MEEFGFLELELKEGKKKKRGDRERAGPGP